MLGSLFQSQVCGSVWLLLHLSAPYIPFIMFGVSTAAILVIRRITEGRVYDKARSSTLGDTFLSIYCGLIALTIQYELPPGLHMMPWWHFGVSVLAVCSGIALHVTGILRGGAWKRFNLLPTQWYHNMIVVPLFGYMVVSTLPVIFQTTHLIVSIVAGSFVFAWTALLAWDIFNGNISRMMESV